MKLSPFDRSAQAHIDIFQYRNILWDMARTRTTFDPFNAIAEPKRRALIETLVDKQLTVSEVVERMGWNQPMVSKHLRVLKQVGLVSERKEGRYRLYEVNAV